VLAGEGFVEQTPNKPGQVHVERYWPKKTEVRPAVPAALVASGEGKSPSR